MPFAAGVCAAAKIDPARGRSADQLDVGVEPRQPGGRPALRLPPRRPPVATPQRPRPTIAPGQRLIQRRGRPRGNSTNNVESCGMLPC